MFDAIAVCAAAWILQEFYADLQYTIRFNQKSGRIKKVPDFVRASEKQEEVALAIDTFLREFTRQKETP